MALPTRVTRGRIGSRHQSSSQCPTSPSQFAGFEVGNPTDWRVELANLGSADMAIEGYTPNPGRTPHPALRDWLLSQVEVGLDTARVVGRIISDPVCDRTTKRCVQWSEKQRFEF